MFLISQGEVEVLDNDNNYICTLREGKHVRPFRLPLILSGEFFGEIVLLINTPRTASVRAKTYCDIYELTKEGLQDVLESFPEHRIILAEIAETRISRAWCIYEALIELS